MIIWLASYPKSGNTWVRSFLSAYYYSSDGNFSFELLDKIKQFPNKEFFNKKIESVDDASKEWLNAQKEIIKKDKLCFLKTHNCYGSFKGRHFTSPEYTKGAVYIVRDPRNILSSLMNHFSIDEENAYKMITNVYRNLKNDNEDYSTYSFISSWNNNYNSWKVSTKIKTIFVKYEDLENNKHDTFRLIINFINGLFFENDKIDNRKLNKAIETTNFDILQKKEELEGFSEAIFSKKDGRKKRFFNLGKKNQYSKLLKSKTIKDVENIFFKEMSYLNYID